MMEGKIFTVNLSKTGGNNVQNNICDKSSRKIFMS
jgi:hypothetical protein